MLINISIYLTLLLFNCRLIIYLSKYMVAIYNRNIKYDYFLTRIN